jgi:hypothetical protein
MSKNLSADFGKLLIIGIFAIILCSYIPCLAQQQQYANAYAYWDFGDEVNDIANVDQKIWIAKPAPASQWVMMWNWVADPAHGGYFGFNTTSEGTAQALFSLWNADQAKGPNCKEFGGEGVGWSCRMPFELKSDAIYKLRLARTRTEAGGVWWGGWIYEESGSAAAKEYYIGEIRVKKEMNLIRGNSIMNFSEYYGNVVEKCGTVPFSILVLAPPNGNREPNSDNYARASKRNGGSDQGANPCQTGGEPQGSLFKVEDYQFLSTDGAVIFFGGTRDDQVMPDGLVPPGETVNNN